MMRDAEPYLTAIRANGPSCNIARARRFHTPAGPGTEICVSLNGGGETVHLSSRYPHAFDAGDLDAELDRAIRDNLVANPFYRGPCQ